MPRRKQRKRFEALHKARWTARTGSSTAATSISPTIAENRNEVGSLAPIYAGTTTHFKSGDSTS